MHAYVISMRSPAILTMAGSMPGGETAVNTARTVVVAGEVEIPGTRYCAWCAFDAALTALLRMWSLGNLARMTARTDRWAWLN
jgi:hypothetical protein